MGPMGQPLKKTTTAMNQDSNRIVISDPSRLLQSGPAANTRSKTQVAVLSDPHDEILPESSRPISPLFTEQVELSLVHSPPTGSLHTFTQEDTEVRFGSIHAAPTAKDGPYTFQADVVVHRQASPSHASQSSSSSSPSSSSSSSSSTPSPPTANTVAPLYPPVNTAPLPPTAPSIASPEPFVDIHSAHSAAPPDPLAPPLLPLPQSSANHFIVNQSSWHQPMDAPLPSFTPPSLPTPLRLQLVAKNYIQAYLLWITQSLRRLMRFNPAIAMSPNVFARSPPSLSMPPTTRHILLSLSSKIWLRTTSRTRSSLPISPILHSLVNPLLIIQLSIQTLLTLLAKSRPMSFSLIKQTQDILIRSSLHLIIST